MLLSGVDVVLLVRHADEANATRVKLAMITWVEFGSRNGANGFVPDTRWLDLVARAVPPIALCGVLQGSETPTFRVASNGTKSTR